MLRLRAASASTRKRRCGSARAAKTRPGSLTARRRPRAPAPEPHGPLARERRRRLDDAETRPLLCLLQCDRDETRRRRRPSRRSRSAPRARASSTVACRVSPSSQRNTPRPPGRASSSTPFANHSERRSGSVSACIVLRRGRQDDLARDLHGSSFSNRPVAYNAQLSSCTLPGGPMPVLPMVIETDGRVERSFDISLLRERIVFLDGGGGGDRELHLRPAAPRGRGPGRRHLALRELAGRIGLRGHGDLRHASTFGPTSAPSAWGWACPPGR